MDNKNVFISIIIPIYNMEKYISKCLDSIIKIKRDDIEIVCINDGSTDNSEYICKSYQSVDNRIRLINKENGGVASARNIGLRVASGKYIAWCDPDDYLSDDWYDSIKRLINKDLDVILFGANLIGFSTNRFIRYKEKSGYIKKEDFIYDICNGRKIQSYLWSMVIKRELWDNISFPPLMSLYEDLSTLHKVVERGHSFFYLDKKIYCYLKHDKNMTNNDKKNLEEIVKNDRLRMKIYKKRYNYLKRRGYNVSKISWMVPMYYFVRNYRLSEENKYEKLSHVCIRIISNNMHKIAWHKIKNLISIINGDGLK